MSSLWIKSICRKNLVLTLVCGSLVFPSIIQATENLVVNDDTSKEISENINCKKVEEPCRGLLSDLFGTNDDEEENETLTEVPTTEVDTTEAPTNDTVTTIETDTSIEPNSDNLEEAPTAMSNEAIYTGGWDEYQGSYLKLVPEKFSQGTFCNIDTIGDPEGGHAKFLDSLTGIIYTYKLAKDKDRPDRGRWDTVNILRRTKYVYPIRLEFDDKYEGYRESYLGIALEKLMFLTKKSNEKFLLNHYKHYSLWNVALADVDELREFIAYLRRGLADQGKRSFEEDKPIIRLRLREGFGDLTLKDWIDLKSLFYVVHPKDIKTIKFFNDTQFKMDDIIEGLSSGKTFSPGIGFRNKIVKKIEDYFEKLDTSEYSSTILTACLSVIAFAALKEVAWDWTIKGYFLDQKYADLVKPIKEKLVKPPKSILDHFKEILNNEEVVSRLREIMNPKK